MQSLTTDVFPLASSCRPNLIYAMLSVIGIWQTSNPISSATLYGRHWIVWENRVSDVPTTKAKGKTVSIPSNSILGMVPIVVTST